MAVKKNTLGRYLSLFFILKNLYLFLQIGKVLSQLQKLKFLWNRTKTFSKK